MVIEHIDEGQILSDTAAALLKDKPAKPDEADGWRTFVQLLEETGLSEAVLRSALRNGIKSGKYDVIKCSPQYYRVVQEKAG